MRGPFRPSLATAYGASYFAGILRQLLIHNPILMLAASQKFRVMPVAFLRLIYILHRVQTVPTSEPVSSIMDAVEQQR